MKDNRLFFTNERAAISPHLCTQESVMNIVPSSIAVRRCLGAAALGGALILAAGCGHNSIVGKWQGQESKAGASSVIEFTPDGKETITRSAGRMSIVVNANYVVKDDNIQVTATGMTMNGQSLPVPPQLSAAQNIPFKLDGDSLTMTPPGSSQAVTLTRIKQ
jgi:hypothetical protein